MSLKQLKAALDAAALALADSPESKDLKSKYAEAKAAYEAAKAEAEDDEDEDEDEDDESEDKSKKKTPTPGEKGDKGDEGDDQDDLEDVLKDPKKAKGYIKALRKENAKYRTKGKNLEERLTQIEKGLKGLVGGEDEDESTPEEKLAAVTQRGQAAAYENLVLEQAIDHGITGKDGRKLFKFYVTEAANELEEGEELSDEDIALIAKKVKGMTGAKGAAKTGVTNSKKGKEEESEDDPNPNDDDEVSLDEFCKMNITQKTKLHAKNPELYNRLFSEAAAKRRL